MRLKVWKLALAAAACSLLGSQAVEAQQSGATQARPVAHKSTKVRAGSYYYQPAEGETPDASPAAAAPVEAASCSTCEEAAAPACGCEEEECSCYLFGPSEAWTLTDPEENCSGIKIGGFGQVGYHSKAQQYFGYNNLPGRAHLHQAWLYAEKATDGACGLDLGGRVDAVYGIDGADTQAFGNNPGNWDYLNGFDHGIYSWALPQAYAELAYNDIKIKAGHFYTVMGYEVVPASGNFFYSHSYTNYNAEPFTHTGALATYTATDKLTLYSGWVLGWDTGYDQLNGGSAYQGGATYQLTDATSVTYTFIYGKLGSRNTAGSGAAGFNHSFVATTTLSDEWTWVINSDLVASNGSSAGPGLNNDQISIVNYLFYKMSDCWSIGGRAEWFKTDGVSIYDITAGLNYRPHANLVIRPEIRYEWSPGGLSTDTATLGTATNTTIFGVDAVVTF